MRKVPKEAQSVANQIAAHLNQIGYFFKDGIKLTLLIRSPDFPDGTRDMLLTSDEVSDVIAALKLRQKESIVGVAEEESSLLNAMADNRRFHRHRPRSH